MGVHNFGNMHAHGLWIGSGVYDIINIGQL